MYLSMYVYMHVYSLAQSLNCIKEKTDTQNKQLRIMYVCMDICICMLASCTYGIKLK